MFSTLTQGKDHSVTRLLLDDRFAPITSEIGFIELPVRKVVDAYVTWHEVSEREPWDESEPEIEGAVVETYYGPDVPPDPPPLPPGEPVLDVREVESLEDSLGALLPLHSGSPRRYVFVATHSGWTAYFDNGWQGTDAFPPMSFLARELGTRALRVVARLDAALLELYGPRDTEWLNVERAVGAVLDGDRWSFVDQGPPLPFEDEARYAARRIRDRFTLELLDEYAGHLGVRPLDDAFYSPPAFVLERRRTPYVDQREYSLEEARAADQVPPPLVVPRRGTLLERLRSLLR
jgi:hypothetical protein